MNELNKINIDNYNFEKSYNLIGKKFIKEYHNGDDKHLKVLYKSKNEEYTDRIVFYITQSTLEDLNFTLSEIVKNNISMLEEDLLFNKVKMSYLEDIESYIVSFIIADKEDGKLYYSIQRWFLHEDEEIHYIEYNRIVHLDSKNKKLVESFNDDIPDIIKILVELKY